MSISFGFDWSSFPPRVRRYTFQKIASAVA